MKHILVTGGSGFIGSHFIREHRKKYPADYIVNLDRGDYCSHDVDVTEPYVFIRGDICDAALVKSILQTYEIDMVVHFAAQTHVDNSFGNSLDFTRDNVMGTHTLLECVKDNHRIECFLHFSTDEVYGEVDDEHAGCDEGSLLNPTNPYAATKAGAESMVMSYFHSYNVPVIISRCNNVYGSYQYPEKLIPRYIRALLDGSPCDIHGTGTQRRSFIHARDVASAVDTILQHRSTLLGKTVNIGTSNEHTVIEIARRLVSIIKGSDARVDDWTRYVADPRPFNDRRYAIDTTKLAALGWAEDVDFTDGLHETLEWYREHLDFEWGMGDTNGAWTLDQHDAQGIDRGLGRGATVSRQTQTHGFMYDGCDRVDGFSE